MPRAALLFNALRARCQHYQEFVERQLEMGLDAYVQIPPRAPAAAFHLAPVHACVNTFNRPVAVGRLSPPRSGTTASRPRRPG